MSIVRRIDAVLWPYLSRWWVYAAAICAFYICVASSAFLALPVTVSVDAISLVVMVTVIGSRDRYVIWRESRPRRESGR